jgi:hypothetical protein
LEGADIIPVVLITVAGLDLGIPVIKFLLQLSDGFLESGKYIGILFPVQ